MELNMLGMFFDIVILFGGLFSFAYTALAYVRFNKGEFKDILAWVMFSYFFAYVHMALQIFCKSPGCMVDVTRTLSSALFVLAIICAFISGKKIYDFSQTFGFSGRNGGNGKGRKQAKK